MKITDEAQDEQRDHAKTCQCGSCEPLIRSYFPLMEDVREPVLFDFRPAFAKALHVRAWLCLVCMDVTFKAEEL